MKIQHYICKRCDETLQMDLTCLIEKNSKFTNELKSKSEHLISDYLENLKNICKSFKRIFELYSRV